MLPPFANLLVAPINHILARAPWAQQRLTAFSGKIVALHIFPLRYRFAIAEDGMLRVASADSVVDTTIALTPGIAIRFLAGDESVQQEMKIEGDTTLAQEMAYLARHLYWDFEEDLSKVFGDVAAHRIGETVRNANAWATEAGNNLAENFRDYWLQEKPLIASREAIDQFNRDVGTLRDDVERLAKRINKL